MVHLHSFKAWHPSPQQVKQVACPPYDVVSTPEARTLAKGNEQSFLHVIRPEIDLPAKTPFNAPSVYKKGAENLRQFMSDGTLFQDDKEALYVYQLIWQGKKQTGIYGCVSVQDYDDEIILKHELTRPDKEDDRTRHIITQQAHAEPVMLTCKDDADIGNIISDLCEESSPLFDFKSPDGITHRLWKVANTHKLTDAFSTLEHLYIADGHHRCKSASRAAHQARQQNPDAASGAEFNYFPAVIFPMTEMNILPYNRLVHHIPIDFKSQLNKKFNLREQTHPTPAKKGEVCFYIDGSWLAFDLPPVSSATAVEQLDAYRLQHFILEPMLGIEDPRRDENISFVGGIRGTKELENRVDSGAADLAISMYPTAIQELIEVSDQHLLMPPKSTWFEPKLLSGLLIHTF